MERKCSEKGEQIQSNLTSKEKRGLKSLLKRIQEGEIVVNVTDKSSKLCVNSMESYIRQGQEHVKNDRAIEWEEVEIMQRRVSSHAKVIVKIFNVGQAWGERNEKRVRDAYSTEAGVVPVLSTMAKDHKPLKESGDPKTRPVVNAGTSVNSRLGDVVSDILAAVNNADEHTDECNSTEEMLYHLGEAAREVAKKGKKVVVASEDADALYPNLDIIQSAKICGEAVRESKLNFDGVDYVWAGKYLAMTCSPVEIAESGLSEVVPKRKYKRGTRPGITTKETAGKKKEGEEEEKLTKWIFDRVDFTEEEKRKLLGKVIEVAVRTTFRNHVYQFEGQMRVQAEGGPIGLRLTGAVARTVMDYWAKKFREMAKQNKMTLYMFKKYVDDVNLVMETLGRGYRWNGKAMEWKQEWEEEDKSSGEEYDTMTMREVRKMSDSILPFINFKEEVASDCKEGKVAMLDFKVWKEERGEENKTEIMFEFYEKPVASKLVLMEGSALPHKMKVTTLSEEVLRRMKNTSKKVGKSRRAAIMTDFMKKMRRSGYGAKMRRNVAIAGLRGYYRMVRVEEEGGRRVNRPRWEGATERRYKKLGGKSNWFKKRVNNEKVASVHSGTHKPPGPTSQRSNKVESRQDQIETVIFVPHTPGSELAKLLQEADDSFTKGKGIGRMKIVERGGTKLKDILCRNNPWSTEGCGRGEECFPCKSQPGRDGKCQKEGIVYKITCEECKMRGICAEYVGESSRTGYLRGGEHMDDLRNRSKKSPLWKHCAEHHEREEVKFSMKVIASHRTPLTRQVQESVEIDNSKAKILLNSKSEYNGSKIPRVVIEVGDQIKEENWQGNDERRNRKVNKKKEGKWNMANMRKRKVSEVELESITEQQNDAEQSVENLKKKRRVESENKQYLEPAVQLHIRESCAHGEGNVRWRGVRTPCCVPLSKYYEGGGIRRLC